MGDIQKNQKQRDEKSMEEIAKKIILELDEYGREVSSYEYGLPIDPDSKSFDDRHGKIMLSIVKRLL